MSAACAQVSANTGTRSRNNMPTANAASSSGAATYRNHQGSGSTTAVAQMTSIVSTSPGQAATYADTVSWKSRTSSATIINAIGIMCRAGCGSVTTTTPRQRTTTASATN